MYISRPLALHTRALLTTALGRHRAFGRPTNCRRHAKIPLETFADDLAKLQSVYMCVRTSVCVCKWECVTTHAHLPLNDNAGQARKVSISLYQTAAIAVPDYNNNNRNGKG